MEDREYQRTRKTRDGGPLSNTDTDTDTRESVADGIGEKAERFAMLPYRVADAFADGELDQGHVIILWWIVSHIAPPRWKYARQIRALAADVRWEETGKSTRTLARKIEELNEWGWLNVEKPQERSRKPWIFRLSGVQVQRVDATATPLRHTATKEGGRFVTVDTLTGEVQSLTPSGLEDGSESEPLYIDVDVDEEVVVEEHSKGESQ